MNVPLESQVMPMEEITAKEHEKNAAESNANTDIIPRQKRPYTKIDDKKRIQLLKMVRQT